MRSFSVPITLAVLLGTPWLAIAHTGGALDVQGCHADHRDDTYHCHRGEAAGYTFPNKAAMLEAVRTGDFPDKTVEAEGFFSKLWPFGNKHEQDDGKDAAPGVLADDAGVATDSGAVAGPAPENGESPGLETGSTVSETPSAAVPRTPEQEDAAQRLKVARGLYEMGLITKEEYEAKRQAILAEL